MKKKNILYVTILFLCMFIFFGIRTVNAEDINDDYDGELGTFYTSNQTIFKVWSSSASKIEVVVEGEINEVKPLYKDESTNVWIGQIGGNLSGSEYTYRVEYADGEIYDNVLDPYGKYFNATGDKNVVYDERLIGFEEWFNQKNWLNVKDKNKVIYGVNIAGLTDSDTWGGKAENQGKLLSLNEPGTRHNNILTGFDYIRDLGITYLELNGIGDNNSPFAIDSKYVSGEYGYSGALELKHVVNDYYFSNIGVVLEFDFNDLSSAFIDNIRKLDKNYYLNNEGNFDLSKKINRKYISDLLAYWVREYKLSGIRIDNMGVFSIDFINELSDRLIAINPNLILYGDGSYKTLDMDKATESAIGELNGVKMLNNSLNHALFGDLNNKDVQGLLSGNYEKDVVETLKFSLLSGVDNGEIDYSLVNGISYKGEWKIKNSYQIINSIGGESSLSIYDKLIINNLTGDNLVKQKVVLAYGSLMSSGGIPYIRAGEEFLVSYQNSSGTEGSICSEGNVFCFYINEEDKRIDWNFAEKNKDIINAFKSLINFRKSSKSVAQTSVKVLKNNVSIYLGEEGVIGFVRNYPNAYVNDVEKVFVVFNYSNDKYTIDAMEGKGWRGLYNYNGSNRDNGNIEMYANSIYIETKEKQPIINQWIILIIILGIIGGLYYVNIILSKKLVEKRGYDVKDISRKYRPFINKHYKSKDNEPDSIQEEDSSPVEEEKNNKQENQ